MKQMTNALHNWYLYAIWLNHLAKQSYYYTRNVHKKLMRRLHSEWTIICDDAAHFKINWLWHAKQSFLFRRDFNSNSIMKYPSDMKDANGTYFRTCGNSYNSGCVNKGAHACKYTAWYCVFSCQNQHKNFNFKISDFTPVQKFCQKC